ncbi:hypothetical protein I4U23_027767 [Adineta vaga]|nr:hypothetical protein I4U23_027767 [Adineta vaga]
MAIVPPILPYPPAITSVYVHPTISHSSHMITPIYPSHSSLSPIPPPNQMIQPFHQPNQTVIGGYGSADCCILI